MNVNSYLAKTYGPQPCWELVADVCASELGAVAVEYRAVNRSIREMAGAFRIALHKDPHGFSQVREPADLCIVLLGKNQRIGIHHCGIYFAGKVLHAMPGATLYEEIASVQDRFQLVEFWAKSPTQGSPA